MNNSTFGAALRHWRDRRNMTQRALGDAAGLHWNYVARLESGGRQPSWDVVCRLADSLGITTDQFRDAVPRGRRGGS